MRILHAILLAIAASLQAAPAITLLPSPAPADSGEPSLFTGPDGTTYLTYAGPGLAAGERAVWLATLAPAADTWSTPRPVVSTALLMENWADFASLTVGTDGQLWVQWFQRRAGEDAHGYDGWFARSGDGGATWSAPAPLGEEFVSLAPLGAGRVLAVWLENAGSADGHAHAGTAFAPAAHRSSTGPTMRLKARLLAPDGSTIQDWVVDPDVCSCCQTTLARLGGDRVLLAYRGHAPGEIRDNHYSIFQQTGWSRPRTLHADGWEISACPVNGPAADARGESVAVTWFTGAGGRPRVQVKQSRDGGIAFGPPARIDLGHPLGRLDLVKLADDSSVISWIEGPADGREASLRLRRLQRDDSLSPALFVAPIVSARSSGFPRLAVRTGSARLEVVVAWTDAEAGQPRCVRTALVDVAALQIQPSAPTSPPIHP